MFTRTTALTPKELQSAIVRNPLVVSPETTLLDAIALMTDERSCSVRLDDSSSNTVNTIVDCQLTSLLLEARSSCVVVVENGQVIGILTERDIVRLSAQQQRFNQLSIRQVMTHPVLTLQESAFTDLFFTVNLLHQHHIRHLPIVNAQAQMVGLLTHESLRQISQPIDLLRLRLVEEVMTCSVICAAPDCSMLAIAQLMAKHCVSSVMIVASISGAAQTLQKPVGIVTERDLVQFQALGLSIENCTAGQVMSTPIFAVKPKESLLVVQQIMEQRLIRRLAVVGEQDELLGIVTQTSLLQALNPLELYKLAEVLEKKVLSLEAEKIELLKNRTADLEQQIEARTVALKTKAEQEVLLTELSTQIRASLNLQTILDTTVEQVRKVLGCDRVNIWRVDSDWRTIAVAESTDSPFSLLGKRIDDTCFREGQAELYRQDHIRIVPDIYTTEMADCHREMLIRIQTRAKILVPILCGNRLWGFLNVSESQHARDWRPDEVKLLSALALQLAIALQQATTHESLQAELKARQQAEAQLENQNLLLAKIAKDEPLTDILQTVISVIEHSQCGSICSVLLLDAENRLHHGAAPHLPSEYLEAIDGIRIGEGMGSCGTASFRGEAVIVSDIATDPLWQGFRDIALSYNLQACYSIPIMASDDRVLGTFGIYYSDVRAPQPLELETITQMANIVGIAIERSQAEASLRESEIRWQFALEGAGDGIWDWNMQTNTVFFSQQWKAMLGYTDEEVSNSPSEWEDRVHPEDLGRCHLLLNKLFSKNTSNYQNEHRLRCKDNSYKWILARGKVIEWTSEGSPLRVIGTHTDVTDRKQAETAIQNLIEGTAATTGEDFFPALVSYIAKALNVSYAIVSQYVDGQLHTLAFWAGGVLQSNLSYRVAKTPCELALHNSRYFCAESVQQRFPDDLDLVDMGANSYLGIALQDHQGNAIGNLCILDQDSIQNPQRAESLLRVFAARAAAELERERATRLLEQLNHELEDKVAKRTAALQASENRYRALMEGASDAIFLADALGNLLEVNQKGIDLLGYSREELIQLNVSHIHPPEVLAVTQAHFQNIQLHHLVPTLESEILRKDGSRVAVEITGSYIELDGEIITQEIFRDVSERAKLEAERKQAEAALRESERRYATLAAAAPVAIFRFERALNCTYVSDRWSELTERPIEDALEYGWLSALHPEDRESLMIHITQQEAQIYLGHPETTYFEGRHLLADGSIRWFYAQVTPETDADGGILGYIGTFTDITQRKQIEAALAKSESKFRHLVERASDLIFSSDIDGNITYLSPQFKTLFGWEPHEWLGKSFLQFIHPDDREFVGNNIQQNLHHHSKSNNAEFRHLHQKGHYLWVRVSASPIRDSEGSVIGIQGILSDISDRKQMEYKVLESQQFIQTVLDTFPISVFWKDRDSVYVGCNRNFLKDAGLKSVEELIGKTDYEMPWGSTEADAYRADDRQVMGSNEARLSIVETQLQADGKQIWLETNKLPLLDPNGELVGVLGTYQDINDRKQAEFIIRQRAEQEKLLREITQRIRQSLDLQTIFDTACQEIRQLMQADRVSVFQFYAESGYDDGAFVAESFVEGISSVMGIQVHDHCFGEKYAPLYLQGRYAAMPDIFQLDQCHTDVLAKINVRANLVVPLLCGDELWGLLCIHQCSNARHWQQNEIDLTQQLANQLAIAIQQANLFEQLQQELTERQQAQRQLTERNQQLAVSNEDLARATRLKDEFLANMSHELRTPLNAILGMTEGLSEKIFGDVNERQIKALNTINQSGTHLLTLINDILDVAKIESGQIELDFTPVAAIKLCNASLPLIKQQALQKKIQIATHFPVNLPDLLVDERRIRQVLINLLSNAVKFTPDGGHITLEIKHSQPSFLRIAVTDTGIGIAPEHLNRLFQPFIQIDSALNRQYQGTGLGLALVKRIVELHGGQVSLTSQLGYGSCFIVDLPCIETVGAGTLNPKSTNRLRSLSQSSVLSADDAPLLLLAEDNEANIATMTSYLEAKGYRLVVAKNGQQAIALAEAEPPDLILMDIQMPEMDGLEAMVQIRRNPDLVEIPMIALTALAMAGDRERCIAAGANDYLTKPIKLKHLVTKIQEFLNANPL